MILKHVAGSKRFIASLMLVVLYIETIIPSYALGMPVVVRRMVKPSAAPLILHEKENAPFAAARKVLTPLAANAFTPAAAKGAIGGPTQPESQAFHSVSDDNMVDLFSGDFSYNVPLMDVGGYPLALGYNSGVGMSEDASWVGLGWNLNPGSITRTLRGLPDDFSGAESVTKTTSVKANTTVGVNVSLSQETIGVPITSKIFNLGASAGIVYNNYRGWGTSAGLSPSINSGSSSMGRLTAGLSITNSSMDGVSVDPNLELQLSNKERTMTGSLDLSTGYNTRSGLKSLDLGLGVQQYNTEGKNARSHADRTLVSYAYPSYLPSPSIPFTNTNLTLTVKGGTEILGTNIAGAITGYVSVQSIASGDRTQSFPAYGYLNYQKSGKNTAVLLDFNREKDLPYKEKPVVPNIGIPSYTYDVFGISGEGIGGTFRAYRSDVGHIFDHYSKTKSHSGNVSADLGATAIAHAGADLTYTYSHTETGEWSKNNKMAGKTAFSSSYGTYEASYFRNPGEMTVNDKDYYNNLGGDDVVAVNIYHNGNSDPTLLAKDTINRFNNSTLVSKQAINNSTYNKTARDKRTQVISYLTAAEASLAGFPKYIENYTENTYTANACAQEIIDTDSVASGLRGEYFTDKNFGNISFQRTDSVINMLTKSNFQKTPGVTELDNNFSVRWTGRIKAPVSGRYAFYVKSDDGMRLYLDGVNVKSNWNVHDVKTDTVFVNLVAGEFYTVRMDYFQEGGNTVATLEWSYPSQSRSVIPKKYLYLPASNDNVTYGNVTLEKRVNSFRLDNHISEINVLNTGGQRYVYGIPVYNLKQTETTFSVDEGKGSLATGLVEYNRGTDNTVDNNQGNDHYFSSEVTPAYAHTFLLTAVLSSDYKDLTGNGITADDPGNAIKFNYTKIAGLVNPSNWRAPIGVNKANYSEGMRTDNRDGKGSYVHGQKELWYLNSIESKTMIAVFKMSNRDDLQDIGENGEMSGSKARKLDEINLYTKAEFMKKNPKPLKTVHFKYSYKLCPGINSSNPSVGKLTLDSLYFTYNNNKKGQRHPYIFHYNAGTTPYNSKNVDRWGVYKPASQNPAQLNNSDYPYAIQDSTLASANVAVWALDSIIIPSGGRMKIDYEGDDYAFVQNKRAAQLFTIAGFTKNSPDINTNLTDLSHYLYQGGSDFQYISVNVPRAVSSKREISKWYLDGLTKVYFRLYVNMPGDKYGSGAEYVPGYASLDTSSYGYFNGGNTIWIKVKAINNSGEIGMSDSKYSPLTKAALSFLRLNLPSKAYPGSETGDDISWSDLIKVIASSAGNILTAISGFDDGARSKGWAQVVQTDRSFVRLNNPYFKKYGGGIRVKRVTIYDYWDKMTGQKQSMYGQEYNYTTTRTVNGKDETISSGVATYEPMIGGEENPWREPIEYTQQVSALAPVSSGYVEAPLGESFFPSPSIGYSRVRVRTINAKNTRSANGFAETCFYTAYDFPTLVDRSTLDKIRFKPSLTNLLRINSRHYIAVTQGFKVELNDMHGKKKSEATYSELDDKKAVTETKYNYKVDNANATFKHLNNTVMVMKPNGDIDESAVVGKDMELMMDMRQQRSLSTSWNAQINGDMFYFLWPPVLFIPMLLNVYNREETVFRSSAVSKVIYRHGVLDNVEATDKGSTVTTRNLLYDSETGAAILNSTQNEWGDSIYTFTLPAGWAYDGMSGAYKNIDVILDSIYINQGRITKGIPAGKKVTDYFATGDRILIYSREKTGGDDCTPDIATFPKPGVIYTVDANVQRGGEPDLYFVDENGQPFTGNSVSLKVLQSGRKNLSGFVNNITLLANPVVKDPISGKNSLVINNTSRVINASAVEYNGLWKVADSRKAGTVLACLQGPNLPYSGDSTKCNTNTTIYYNHRYSKSYTPDCATGVAAYQVTYVVPANKYPSLINQDSADARAIRDLDSNGKNYANAHATCVAKDSIWILVTAGSFQSTSNRASLSISVIDGTGKGVGSANASNSSSYKTYQKIEYNPPYTVHFNSSLIPASYSINSTDGKDGVLQADGALEFLNLYFNGNISVSLGNL
ncbi:PA14 domain-containing protein [Chitinophaga sancti]|uniref:PA14 domain-containing protein n=1 Tax=Chitinophaga sancti TaxID=1004 RepID=A0A1K1SD69_9BACT|nr:PA14 domain-containing protein [Chitinophaga sancti]WQD63605.1 PA14 domain-containing protein [Chitinophaga sancti]WQG90770.1 PA14 domain-containing protein [Chitinophaga sancti]SFW81999.1 PA14 domain-containing protein [Chitinophaga sancti]